MIRAIWVVVIIVVCSSDALALDSNRSPYAAAVDYCRSMVGQLTLNDDRSIFCFDGLVSPDRDASSLIALNDGGLFVVRSQGGSGTDAIKIATLLGEKRATVVIYDYCISACAHFFFVASARTYVSKDTIVAWHHGWLGWPLCDAIAPRRVDNAKRLTRTFCHSLPEQYQKSARKLQSLAEPFYKNRVIELAEFSLESPPQSAHMARILRSRFESTGTYPSVVWMWNPRYFKTKLKTEIIYESYPENQDRVDELATRFFGQNATGFFGSSGGRVLHDP
jgi:hypothetical protein